MKTEIVKVRLTPKEYKKWKAFAAERGETLASTVRTAMRLLMSGMLSEGKTVDLFPVLAKLEELETKLDAQETMFEQLIDSTVVERFSEKALEVKQIIDLLKSEKPISYSQFKKQLRGQGLKYLDEFSGSLDMAIIEIAKSIQLRRKGDKLIWPSKSNR